MLEVGPDPCQRTQISDLAAYAGAFHQGLEN